MKNGKYCNGKKSLNMKPLAVLLALTLLVGCAVGGTIAWLTAETDDVNNTFTIGDITIGLTEHLYDEEEDELTAETTPTNSYDFVPGDTLPKDPYVTVDGGSESCYVFIKVTETGNIKVTNKEGVQVDAMQYAVESYNETTKTGWKPVKDQAGYWYCYVEKSDEDIVLNILQDKKVFVSPYITKENMTGLNFKLSIDAAAIQTENLISASATEEQNVKTAWDELPAAFKP